MERKLFRRKRAGELEQKDQHLSSTWMVVLRQEDACHQDDDISLVKENLQEEE
ncbi:hypothetical protein [Ferrimonas sp.]|uniref:hypothetical protein n=1 Tax=Ferrimonas sp. TaxID=2080861 RepID=UPI003A933CAB